MQIYVSTVLASFNHYYQQYDPMSDNLLPLTQLLLLTYSFIVTITLPITTTLISIVTTTTTTTSITTQ